MKNRRLKPYDLTSHPLVHTVVFIVAILSLGLQSSVARSSDLVPDEYRVGKTIAKFEDTRLYAAAYKLRAPRQLRSQYLELLVGAISAPGETRPLVSLGPVWRFPLYGDRVFLGLGFSPTLLGGSTFGDRDMGGNVHFTSSASLETVFGLRRSLSLALRLQHTSNGGLNRNNPGMDVVALNVSYIPNK